MLDVVAAGASTTVESLSILHLYRNGADIHRSRDLPLINIGELAFIVADDSAVILDDVEVFPFLVDDFPKVVADLVLVVQEPYLLDNRLAFRVFQGYDSGFLIDCQ